MDFNPPALPIISRVRERLDSWLDAVRQGDIDRIASHYAADIVAYDAIMQLQFKGIDAYKEHWRACITMCNGPMTFEVDDVHIIADETLALIHCVFRCGGAGDNGEEKATWMRMTSAMRKSGEQWLVVHEHFSAPFDVVTGKALFELAP